MVLRDTTGNAIVVFRGSPPQASPIASVSATCTAGSICFKQLGSQPGISADGRVVAFYGVEEVDNGNGALVQQPNIFVSVHAGDGNRVIQRVVAGTLADTFADLTLAKDQRIGVLNRGGEPNLDTVLGDPNAELVSVVFVASLQDPTPGGSLTLPGIYSVDLLYRDLGGTRVLLGRAEPRTIAQKGQLNAVTGTAFDTFTLTDPIAQDKVLKSPLIVFQATMSDGQSAVFRARKNCDVQGVRYFNQADALWGNQLYAFRVPTDPVPLIRQLGCTLSASASLPRRARDDRHRCRAHASARHLAEGEVQRAQRTRAGEDSAHCRAARHERRRARRSPGARLGFDADGSAELDFGSRMFRVSFDEHLKPFVRDADGKRLNDLPKPGKNDDADKAADAVERYKNIKKDARALASQQILRLELAMCARRRWSVPVFRTFLLEHPLVGHLVKRLLWGTYDQEHKLIGAFRVAEDRTLADANDDQWDIAEDASVGLVHAYELPQSEAAAFGQLFGDYEILQPFRQLGREIYRLTAEDAAAAKLQRRNATGSPPVI